MQGKADKDVQNENSQTPLHLAVQRQHTQIVRVSRTKDWGLLKFELSSLSHINWNPGILVPLDSNEISSLKF